MNGVCRGDSVVTTSLASRGSHSQIRIPLQPARRDLEQVLRMQLLCNNTASAPPIGVKCTSELPVSKARYQISVVLYNYCIE